MDNHTEKYTVITGASSGIGYETALAFASRGKNLILTARRLKNLEQLKNVLSQKYSKLNIVISPADLSDLTQARQFYDSLHDYPLETWINNAGFGNYSSVADQNLEKTESMLRLNIESLTLLTSLFVRDYQDCDGAQLINISSAGGYTIVPNAVTYCAAKFYVSAFTEGLSHELKETKAKLQAKVLAPAATQTEFGKVASGILNYDYDESFTNYHSSRQMAAFLMDLYDSSFTVGIVDRNTLKFQLSDPLLSYARPIQP